MGRESLGLYLRSALFAILLPGTVVGFIPLWLSASRWRFSLGTWRLVGVLPLLFGAPLLIWCIAEFARRGRGTLAPIDPPKSVVRTGAYRWTRNPMYVGVLSILIGETLVTGSKAIGVWTCIFALCVNIFVIFYEEPTLARQFGEDYLEYRRSVPRWVSLRPTALRCPRRRSRRGAGGEPP
jgi:protein-S-isoprenylcysteine O-methyltransferase Ste14